MALHIGFRSAYSTRFHVGRQGPIVLACAQAISDRDESGAYGARYPGVYPRQIANTGGVRNMRIRIGRRSVAATMLAIGMMATTYLPAHAAAPVIQPGVSLDF